MKKTNFVDIDVIAFSDLKDNECREFRYGDGDWPFRGFVVHYKNNIYAYQNYCMHAGHQLNWQPNEFLTFDKNQIICASHGAIYDIESGLCVSGPCKGKKLRKIECFIRNDRVLVRCPESL